MRTVIHKLGMVNLEGSKPYQKKKINFIHPNPTNQFKETHSWFKRDEKKKAKYEYKLSKTLPNHNQSRYEMLQYFIDTFSNNTPNWGSFNYKPLKS